MTKLSYSEFIDFLKKNSYNSYLNNNYHLAWDADINVCLEGQQLTVSRPNYKKFEVNFDNETVFALEHQYFDRNLAILFFMYRDGIYWRIVYCLFDNNNQSYVHEICYLKNVNEPPKIDVKISNEKVEFGLEYKCILDVYEFYISSHGMGLIMNRTDLFSYRQITDLAVNIKVDPINFFADIVKPIEPPGIKFNLLKN